jgi:branched-chain amino acid transport system ATP-binding protein
VILAFEHVTKRFGELAAVNDLSFAVEEGEIFGIAGPNGAGKTTVFNVISGFYHGSGTIKLDGKRIDGKRPYEVCHMGVARTFQLPVPFASMTVRKNLEIGDYWGRQRGRKVGTAVSLDGLMEFLGLTRVADSPVTTLKLYDKKLTVLGAALATAPRLLLLDEAIAGLSVIEADAALDLIGRINRERGISIVIIEHLMSVLTALCSHLMVMNNGAALKQGVPSDVMEDPEVKRVLLGVKSDA